MANETFIIGSDNYPIPINAPEIPASYMIKPYPAAYWRIEEGEEYPSNGLMPDLPASYMIKPYPAAYWRIEEGEEYPSNGLMPDLPANGAFANASKLTQISIPQSVKYIGDEAFKNTELKSVRIANDCIYFDTSFPEDCTINFYP